MLKKWFQTKELYSRDRLKSVTPIANTGMESRFGQMEPNMKGIGGTMSPQEKEYSSMWMETNTMVSVKF